MEKLTRVPCRAARSHMQHVIAGRYPSHYMAANALAYAYVKQTGNLI